MKTHKRNKRLIAIVVAAAIAVSAVIALVSATLAVQLAPAVRVDCANPNPSYKQLAVGDTETEKMPGQGYWTSTNAAIAQATKLTSGTAEVAGISPGVAQIISTSLTGKIGRRANYQIYNADGISSVVLSSASTTIGLSDTEAEIPVTTVPSGLESSITWEPQAGDNDIITVSGKQITVKTNATPGITAARGTFMDKYGITQSIYFTVAYGVEADDGGTELSLSAGNTCYSFTNPNPSYKQLDVGSTVTEKMPGQARWISSYNEHASVLKITSGSADVTGNAPGITQIISTTLTGKYGRRANYQVAKPDGINTVGLPHLGMLLLDEEGSDISAALNGTGAIAWAPVGGEDDFITVSGNRITPKEGAQPGFTGVVGQVTDKWGISHTVYAAVAYKLQIEGTTPIVVPPTPTVTGFNHWGTAVEQIIGKSFIGTNIEFFLEMSDSSRVPVDLADCSFFPSKIAADTTEVYVFYNSMYTIVPLTNGVAPPPPATAVRLAISGEAIQQINGTPFDPEGLYFWFVMSDGTWEAVGTTELVFTPNPIAATDTVAYAKHIINNMTVEIPLVNGVKTVFNPWPLDPEPDNLGTPAPRTGRTLSASEAKDSSAWIEIASYSDIFEQRYSLMLRVAQIDAGATATGYTSGAMRTAVNTFMKSTLPSNSPIRSYLVTHNAMSKMGTYGSAANLSIPNSVLNNGLTTNDIGFALSYGEAARFCSAKYNTTSSNPKALANYGKLGTKQNYWLRTDNNTQVAFVDGSATPAGTLSSAAPALSKPYRVAVWVKSELLGTQIAS